MGKCTARKIGCCEPLRDSQGKNGYTVGKDTLVKSQAEKGGFRRVTRFVLGVGFFTVGTVLYYLTKRRREAEQTPAPEGIPISPPDREVARPTPAEAPKAQLTVLPLTIKADPARFVRRGPGTIVAQTLPGAACTIEAVYSTGRRPGSLETDPVTANRDGECRWTWEIGTGGSHVDVTVRAQHEGYDQVETSLQVGIGD